MMIRLKRNSSSAGNTDLVAAEGLHQGLKLSFIKGLYGDTHGLKHFINLLNIDYTLFKQYSTDESVLLSLYILNYLSIYRLNQLSLGDKFSFYSYGSKTLFELFYGHKILLFSDSSA